MQEFLHCLPKPDILTAHTQGDNVFPQPEEIFQQLLKGAGDPLGSKGAPSRAEKQRFPKDDRMELTLDQFITCTTERSFISILQHVYSFLSLLHLNRHFYVHPPASFYTVTAVWVIVIPCVSHWEFSACSKLSVLDLAVPSSYFNSNGAHCPWLIPGPGRLLLSRPNTGMCSLLS